MRGTDVRGKGECVGGGERGEEGRRGEQGPCSPFTKSSPAPLRVGLVVDRRIASHTGANLACEKVVEVSAPTALSVSLLFSWTLNVWGLGSWIKIHMQECVDEELHPWKLSLGARLQKRELKERTRLQLQDPSPANQDHIKDE